MQKISVVIIRQGLLLLFSDWITRLRGAGTASCSNGSVGVSIGQGQWYCHEVSGRNTYASNSKWQVEEIQVLNSSIIGSLALH